MNHHLYFYGISLGIHIAIFLLAALFTYGRPHYTPPVMIDFTINEAQTSVATPAEEQHQPRRSHPPRRESPQPQVPAEVARGKSVQTFSEVVSLQAPEDLSSRVGVQDVSPPTQQIRGAAEGGGTENGDRARIGYLKEQFGYIRDKIAAHVCYPRYARRMGWSGIVHVSFIIEQNGSVSDIQIVRSSLVNLLDKEASDAVRRSAPFPRPPIRARIIIPVEFVLS